MLICLLYLFKNYSLDDKVIQAPLQYTFSCRQNAAILTYIELARLLITYLVS